MSQNQAVQLLTRATASQRAKVREKLDALDGSYSALARLAKAESLRAFDDGDYSHAAIARIMTPEVIKEIFG